MEILKVGDFFTALANRGEGTFFDIADSGLVWFFNYNSPSDTEIADISEGSAFEIREMLLDGVMWVFLRCGSMPWVEAPYHPHLSRSPSLMPIEDDSTGYALTLVMVDATTQTIRHIRVIGLGTKFCRQLRADVLELMPKPFDARIYDAAIRKAQTVYSTPQMVRLCRNYWRLR